MSDVPISVQVTDGSTAIEGDASGVDRETGPGIGVLGRNDAGDGVQGQSSSSAHAGVSAINNGGGFGLWATGNVAGHFEGDVEINGVIRAIGNLGVTGNLGVDGVLGVSQGILTGAGINTGGIDARGDVHVGGTVTVDVDVVLTGGDCAEEFDVSSGESIEPGTVMVINEQGALQPSQSAYDKNVAGVMSGAGNCKPGIVLGRQASATTRVAIALVGKVHCKIDAQYAPVKVGDLLTTSPTPGHAMKAEDASRAFGSVIGKALRPLQRGQGLIPILVALQ